MSRCRGLAVLAALVVGGCHSLALPPNDEANTRLGDGGIGDAVTHDGRASADADSNPPPQDLSYPVALHSPLPQIPFGGGAVLDAVSLVSLFWPGDPLAAKLADFDQWLVGSEYWKTTLAEYLVGPGSQVAVARFPVAAPAHIDDLEIERLIQTEIAAGRIPPITPERLYSVYVPATTTVTVSSGGVTSTGCVDFGGYHAALQTADGTLYYSVVPRCTAPGMDTLSTTTMSASHELAETCTDPSAFVTTSGWVLSTADSSDPLGGEIGDLCRGYPLSIANHVVTALYSNRAAAAAERPCVPAPAGPLVGAALMPDAIDAAPGAPRNGALTLYSTAALPAPMRLRATSLTPSRLSVSLGANSGQNGDRISFTVTPLANARSGDIYIVAFTASTADYHMDSYLLVHVP